jgi:tetratricopeptide (TPR) repeat protein
MPMNPGKIALALATLVLCAAVPVAARAESEAEKKQQAKEHYEMATRFYDVGKYGEAIAEYEQAYLLVEDAALLFNIGQAYRLWDRPEDAIRAYKNFLRRRPDAGNRADVERKIADLEKLVEERRRGLPGQPTPAPVQPAQPISPPGPGLAPGAEGPAPVPGGPASLAPAAAPRPEPPPGVAFEQPRQEEPASPKKKWIAYSLLGLGGACLVTTVIAAAAGASKAKTLQDASQNRQPFDPAVESSGKKANAVAGVAAIVGIASVGVGGYLLWKWRGTAAPSVSVAPVAAPTFAGGSALLTF